MLGPGRDHASSYQSHCVTCLDAALYVVKMTTQSHGHRSDYTLEHDSYISTTLAAFEQVSNLTAGPRSNPSDKSLCCPQSYSP